MTSCVVTGGSDREVVLPVRRIVLSSRELGEVMTFSMRSVARNLALQPGRKILADYIAGPLPG